MPVINHPTEDTNRRTYHLDAPLPPPIQRKSRSQTIRASEIGTFLYCERAWWYQRKGEISINQAEMLTGTQLHRAHGRSILKAGVLRLAGYALALIAVILITIALTNQWLP